MAFLTVGGINAAINRLRRDFPALCTVVMLPERSVELRRCRAVRIRAGTATDRCGVLLTGGVHARELMNPDGLVSWAFDLCEAFDSGAGLTFGSYAIDADTVALLLESLDIFIVPLVNPDGRAFVLDPSGDSMWRKNRAQNDGDCRGVDLNRNCDLLWESNIGSSTDSCSDLFRGPSAFSEPETRNIKALIDDHPHISCYMDVHSFSELVLYPWGVDENQTGDPNMNFQNPDFDDIRGTEGDADYREFMPAADLDEYQSTAEGIRSAIEAVRGHSYTVGPSFTTMYPTSGTIKDFCYSRHFVDTGLRKIRAFLLETGTEFQPDDAETTEVMREIGAAATALCVQCYCACVAGKIRFNLPIPLDPFRLFRDQVLGSTAAGRRYVRLFRSHGIELMRRAVTDEKFRAAAADVAARASALFEADVPTATIDPPLLRDVAQLLEQAAEGAGPSLARALEEVRTDLSAFEGRTVIEALRSLDRSDRR